MARILFLTTILWKRTPQNKIKRLFTKYLTSNSNLASKKKNSTTSKSLNAELETNQYGGLKMEASLFTSHKTLLLPFTHLYLLNLLNPLIH